MKITLIQTNPKQDRAANLARIEALMEEAVRTDAPDLIVLPEYFELYGTTLAEKLASAEPAPGGAAYAMAQEFAKKHGVYVHAGTIMERIEDGNRIYNTTFVFDRTGAEIAAYRKIHMFDIDTPDGISFRKSDSVKPGDDLATYEVDGLKIGCAICYDIRFFELFLQYQKAGCDVIVLPAAFTLQTGKDHWEVLARARAIETQTYFAACGQIGSVKVEGVVKSCYGNSLVVDPWGLTIARASDSEGFVTARIDPAQVARVRKLIPMMKHRRLACY